MWTPGQTQARPAPRRRTKELSARWVRMQQLAQTGLYTPSQIAEMTGSTRNVVYKTCSGLPYRVEDRPKRIYDDVDPDPIPTADFHPTDAPVGSSEKIAVLARRAELGQPLWHPADRNDLSGLGRLPTKTVYKDKMVHDSGPGIRCCAAPKVDKGLE